MVRPLHVRSASTCAATASYWLFEQTVRGAHTRSEKNVLVDTLVPAGVVVSAMLKRATSSSPSPAPGLRTSYCCAEQTVKLEHMRFDVHVAARVSYSCFEQVVNAAQTLSWLMVLGSLSYWLCEHTVRGEHVLSDVAVGATFSHSCAVHASIKDAVTWSRIRFEGGSVTGHVGTLAVGRRLCWHNFVLSLVEWTTVGQGGADAIRCGVGRLGLVLLFAAHLQMRARVVRALWDA